MDTTISNSQHRPFSIKLWPPSQNTRLKLVDQMAENFSNPSVFTRKFGIWSKKEALENAKRIEDAAFVIANEHYEKEPDGDGNSAVQLYAKECSKLVLDVLKKGPSAEEAVKPDRVPEFHEICFDISKGKRAFIEAEEAKELLSPLEEPGNSYTKVCFSNRSFGLDAANVAEPILASIKDQLMEVDLSDFVAGRPEREALDVMSIFSAALEGCTLRALNLSDNALGEKGVRAFGQLLQSQNNLEELYLMNDGISVDAARAVCELLPSTEKLKVLHFHNNMTGDGGAMAIAEIVRRSPLLEDFKCSSSRVGSEGGKALSEALAMCSHLKKLDLKDNIFGVDAGLSLGEVLKKHAKLTEINLSYLNLEDEGVIAIANVLKESSPLLQVLALEGNEITAAAAPSLAACVARKELLVKLNLADNELKDDGVLCIANALEEGHVQLKEVDMSATSMRRAGSRRLARVLVQKPEFEKLYINGNFISEEGVDEIREIFKKFPDKLGPLDDNDPEGEEDDHDEESGDEANDSKELESRLENLDVKS